MVRTESTQVRPSKIFTERTNKFKDEDVLLETGLPCKLTAGIGNRTIYTSLQNEPSLVNLGLLGLCLYGNLNLCSDNEYLAYSLGDGRVVLF